MGKIKVIPIIAALLVCLTAAIAQAQDVEPAGAEDALEAAAVPWTALEGEPEVRETVDEGPYEEVEYDFDPNAVDDTDCEEPVYYTESHYDEEGELASPITEEPGDTDDVVPEVDGDYDYSDYTPDEDEIRRDEETEGSTYLPLPPEDEVPTETPEPELPIEYPFDDDGDGWMDGCGVDEDGDGEIDYYIYYDEDDLEAADDDE
ncbi:hypothetical protein OAA99_01860 [Omnitrophica bacterium]|nr:hypothetical protein [Candidatus Omnitrophota bacterium]